VGIIQKIISGGQTGADRAALDVAIEFGIPHGGWVPKGRKTESGRLPGKYQLREIHRAGYPKRTEQKALDSEGTLILSYGNLHGGSALIRKLAKKHKRPYGYTLTWIHCLCLMLKTLMHVISNTSPPFTIPYLYRNEVKLLLSSRRYGIHPQFRSCNPLQAMLMYSSF
jgi:hypothetical protein